MSETLQQSADRMYAAMGKLRIRLAAAHSRERTLRLQLLKCETQNAVLRQACESLGVYVSEEAQPIEQEEAQVTERVLAKRRRRKNVSVKT